MTTLTTFSLNLRAKTTNFEPSTIRKILYLFLRKGTFTRTTQLYYFGKIIKLSTKPMQRTYYEIYRITLPKYFSKYLLVHLLHKHHIRKNDVHLSIRTFFINYKLQEWTQLSKLKSCSLIAQEIFIPISFKDFQGASLNSRYKHYVTLLGASEKFKDLHWTTMKNIVILS